MNCIVTSHQSITALKLCLRVKQSAFMKCSLKLLFYRYANAYDVQMMDQSNYWRVPAQLYGCGGTPAEMLQIGWFFPMQQNQVLMGKVFAGCSYAICNRMVAKCLAVRKTLIKAIELGFCGLVLISSRGVEDLFLGKKVPLQLLELIEDQVHGIWRMLLVYKCCARESQCRRYGVQMFQ